MRCMKILVLLVFISFITVVPCFAGGSSEQDPESIEASEEFYDEVKGGLSTVMGDFQSLNDDMLNTAAGRTTSILLRGLGSIFDEIFTLFYNQLNLSFVNAARFVLPKLFGCLLVVELSYLAILAIIQQEMSMAQMFRKLFIACITIILAANMNLIVEGLNAMFARIGFVIGDPSYGDSFIVETPIGTIFQPSDLVNSFRTVLTPLQTLLEALQNFKYTLIDKISVLKIWGIAQNIIEVGTLSILCYVVYIIQFLLLLIIAFSTMNVTFWLIEFQILMVVACILIPWQVFDPTKFLGSGIWQALFGQAIKIFCIILMVAIAPPLIERAIFTQNLTETIVSIKESGSVPTTAIMLQILTTIVIVVVYCYFLMKAPAIAKALIVGQPTMETLGSHYIVQKGAAMIGVLGSGIQGIGAWVLSKVLHPFNGGGGSSSQQGSGTGGTNEGVNTDKFAGSSGSAPQQPRRGE